MYHLFFVGQLMKVLGFVETGFKPVFTIFPQRQKSSRDGFETRLYRGLIFIIYNLKLV